MKYFFLTFILLSNSFFSVAQLQIKEAPISAQLKLLSKQVPLITVKATNADSLEKEETKDTNPRPWRFGDIAEVAISLDNSGDWTPVNGGKLWRLELESANALSLNFIFNDFKIPPGAKFFIYSAYDTLGAFTDRNNQADQKFATTLVRGSKATFEYFEPTSVPFKGSIGLSKIVKGFRDVFKMVKAFGGAGTCNNNVNCPSGNDWQDQKRGVVMLVVGGSGFCTGTVMNNTDNNQKPYVLTADHCYGDDESTWVFWFNWESANCTNPSSSPTYQSLSGSVLKARSSDTDFCLVEINTSIPSTYNPYYVGWSRSSSGSPSGTVIHHPSGDIKKISFYSTTLTASSWSGSTLNHWRAYWSSGVTEPGSSGSALFDNNKRLVGQLHGGPSACGATSLYDEFGMFHLSWDGSGTSTTRLKDWLDPSNSNPAFLDGINSCNVGATLAPSSGISFCPGNPPVQFTVTDIPNATYTWRKDGIVVGTNTNTYSANAVGNYTVTVSTATCSNSLGPVSLFVPTTTYQIMSKSGSFKYCPNTSTVLKLSSPSSNATFQWTWSGYALHGATSDSLVVSTAGNYAVNVNYCGTTVSSNTLNIIAPPKSPVPTVVSKTVCNLTNDPIPNYSLQSNDVCGTNNFSSISYTGGTIGYDGGLSSGSNPTINLSDFGALISMKVSITWLKKAGGNQNSCGTAHTGGNPYNGEVSFKLRSPTGRTVNLVLSGAYTSSTYGGLVTTVLTDSATVFPSGYPISGTFKPQSPLSDFYNESPNGTWTLLPADAGSTDPLCVSGFSITFYSQKANLWYAQNNYLNLLNKSYTYTPNTFNEGINTYYVASECSIFCPSDLVPITLNIDCNCNNSTNLTIVGNTGQGKQTQQTIVTASPNTIVSGNIVEYKAGNSVTLNPGFIANPANNGLFKASIQGCN